MEQHFDFDDLEAYYQAWYKNVPGGWAELKRRGVWHDPNRPKDYELYERPISRHLLDGATTEAATGIVRDPKGRSVGIMQDGKPVAGFPTPSRKIQIYDEVFALAARHAGVDPSDINAQPLVNWAGLVVEKERRSRRGRTSTMRFRLIPHR